MRLHQLKPAHGSRPRKVIVGRGEGSGLGQTAGKGQKGQTSRSGEGRNPGFEGGQTPLMRRIPKRGFNHPSKIHYLPINLGQLETAFDAGAQVTPESLVEKKLLRRADVAYKILGGGKLTKKLNIKAPKFSESAQKAVQEAGGTLAA